MTERPAPLLRVERLARYFDVSPPFLNRVIERSRRAVLKAVDGVDFSIARGETFALVGESGCGKSTVARLVLGLYAPTRGRVIFDGIDTGALDRRARRALRRRMQMIFQDPSSSLDPRWRARDIIAEPLRTHRVVPPGRALETRIDDLLDQVRLSPADSEKYPHQFSVGQRQRLAIARALAASPDLVVCDEPTSALDVSVQAQILTLLQDLQRRLGLTYLFISHNLAVVYHVATTVGVMYLGRLVEVADTATLFAAPRHPYTRFLLATIPDLATSNGERAPLTGEVPNPIEPPQGCAFHPRCPYAGERCRRERPELRPAGRARVACHAVEEGLLSAD